MITIVTKINVPYNDFCGISATKTLIEIQINSCNIYTAKIIC